MISRHMGLFRFLKVGSHKFFKTMDQWICCLTMNQKGRHRGMIEFKGNLIHKAFLQFLMNHKFGEKGDPEVA